MALIIKVGDTVQFTEGETPMTGVVLYACGINGVAVELNSGAERYVNLGTITAVL